MPKFNCFRGVLTALVVVLASFASGGCSSDVAIASGDAVVDAPSNDTNSVVVLAEEVLYEVSTGRILLGEVTLGSKDDFPNGKVSKYDNKRKLYDRLAEDGHIAVQWKGQYQLSVEATDKSLSTGQLEEHPEGYSTLSLRPEVFEGIEVYFDKKTSSASSDEYRLIKATYRAQVKPEFEFLVKNNLGSDRRFEALLKLDRTGEWKLVYIKAPFDDTMIPIFGFGEANGSEVFEAITYMVGHLGLDFSS